MADAILCRAFECGEPATDWVTDYFGTVLAAGCAAHWTLQRPRVEREGVEVSATQAALLDALEARLGYELGLLNLKVEERVRQEIAAALLEQLCAQESWRELLRRHCAERDRADLSGRP